MKKTDIVGEWLRFAKMDLGVAEHLGSMRPQPLEIICYHCQQSVEKCLKSIMIAHGIEVIKTHDLTILYRVVMEICPAINVLKNACAELNRYGSQPRYPEELEINETHTQVALREAKLVYEKIYNLFD